jgi:hypothetical protein
MSRRRALGLVEALLVLGLGTFFAVITASALSNVLKVYNNTSGRDSALRELNRARGALERDLSLASKDQMSIGRAPGSLGGGADGDYFQTLSAVNASTGEVAVLEDGSGNPYLFQNLVYYATVSAAHNSCFGGNEGGYDYNCPHKVLVRVLQDQNPTYDWRTLDELIVPVGPLLTRPAGQPNQLARSLVAKNLLTFQVVRWGDELRVDLRAVSLSDAGRKLALGSTSLRDTGYTLNYRFSAYPRN